MATTNSLIYPDYTGSQLTNGAFAEMVQRHVTLLTTYGLEELGLTTRMAALVTSQGNFTALVKQQTSWSETPTIVRYDKARDGEVRVVIYMIEVLAQTLPDDDELGQAARRLLPTAKTYKNSQNSELARETTELNGLTNVLMSALGTAAQDVQKLGLTNHVKAIYKYNGLLQEAMSKREAEQGERINKHGGKTTAEFRSKVKDDFLAVVRRVNAQLDAMDEPTEKALKLVADAKAVEQHYKTIVANAQKSKAETETPDETTAE